MPTTKLLDGPEAITLAEAKAHLRVDHSDEDVLITALIKTARHAAESRTGRAITSTQFKMALDAFPDGPIELLVPKLITVDSVKYWDVDGVQQTIASIDYFTDAISEPGWVSAQPGLEWPSTQARMNAVEITYTAGYTEVPFDLRAWMLLVITDLYERRAASAERPALPQKFADSMLETYKVWGV